MTFKGPLAQRYVPAVMLVVCALVPYLVLSTALTPVEQGIGKDLAMSKQSLQLVVSLADAAYAFGTVLALQLALHLPQRRLLVVYAGIFVAASALAAGAWAPWAFAVGHILQGACTSLMLIAAVPPLVTGWPAAKMKWTAVVMNVCIFGAVALGPAVGGIQAGSHGWRLLLWLVTGVGVLAVVFTILTYEDQEPQDSSAPWDWVAQGLAGIGCAAAFFGAAELSSHRFLDPIAIIPLAVGTLAILGLLVHQYRSQDPLMPIERLTTTLPVVGIVIAMFAGAASVGVVTLVETAMQGKISPAHLGVLFLPEFAGAIVTALVFGAIVSTRLVPVMPFAGMTLLAVGALVLTAVTGGSQSTLAIGVGLLGLGVGASVSPALFTAGFSQESGQIQRVFALIELLRGFAAFIFAPLILHLAMTVASRPPQGIKTAMWTCVGVAAAGGVTALAVFLIGRTRLHVPKLDAWLDGDEPALPSPPLFDAIRQ